MNKLGDHIPIKGIVDAKTDQEFKTYYIIYFNLVGSSRPNISLEQQIRKLNDFNDMIYQTINATVFYDNSHIFFPDYYSSTGDGAVFCFTNPTDPFEFSVVLHSKLYRYNRIKSEGVSSIISLICCNYR